MVTGRSLLHGVTPHARPIAITPLSMWIKAHGVTAYALAKIMQTDPGNVYLWAKGQQLPTLIEAFLLEKVTGGGVPAAAWLGTALAKERNASRGMDWDRWRAKMKEQNAKYYQKRKARGQTTK